jgi:hypothetical protein
MYIEAVDVPKPEEPKKFAPVDMRNPVRSHNWRKDKNVCCVCQTTLDEAKFENIFCEQAEGAGA